MRIDPSKIKVIYEGTDKTLVGNNISSQKKEYFLYIGNAYPHKNLEFLLNTFKNLPSNFKLILVGKEDYFYKRLKRKTKKLNLERKVDFFGYASDKELSSLYKKAKALIIPSFIEGFGLPALEAMANRCLVLASNTPTLKEVCGESAIYFDPKREDDLSEKLLSVSKDPNQFKNYIDKGIKRSKEFSWEKTAEETLKIYEGCASLR